MQSGTALFFGPFRLASREGPLTREGVEIKLQAKALALLWTLARQAGEVVTKTALFDAVWPRAVVMESALAFQINALRQALGDDPKAPRYIATVHRIGLRFVAAIRRDTDEPRPPDAAPPSAAELAPVFVGREPQLQQLLTLFAKALSGRRQLLFVSGEAGIGKSALVARFVSRMLESREDVLVATGQCVEHSGPGEAYLPILEALGRLCRRVEGDLVLKLLRACAPSWLMQLPALLSEEEYDRLRTKTAGVPRERMLREMAQALDIISAERPLLLVLEDLHWSDTSTLELLSTLARRTENARLMVVCTYRPVDAILAGHPVRTLKHELTLRGYANEAALDYLVAADVRCYLQQRFGTRSHETDFAAFVHRRTEGQPLLMTQLVDYLVAQGAGSCGITAEIESAVPQGLRELIATQLEQLPEDEQKILETASVEGDEFTVAMIAATCGVSIENAERFCETLARQGRFLSARGLAIWPDGTMSGRYAFRHALLAEALRSRIGDARRARLHRAIAERKVLAYGNRATEIAAELARHFEAARLPAEEAHFRLMAARKADTAMAASEARLHAQAGLRALESLPADPRRPPMELALLLIAARAIQFERGSNNIEAMAYLTRACALPEDAGTWEERMNARFLLALTRLFRGQAQTSAEAMDEIAQLSAERDTALSCLACALGTYAWFWHGDQNRARRASDRGKALLPRMDPLPAGSAANGHPATAWYNASQHLYWIQGYPDEALAIGRQSVACATRVGNLRDLTVAMAFPALFHVLRREPEQALQAGRACLAAVEAHGWRGWVGTAEKSIAIAQCMRGETQAELQRFRAIVAAEAEAGMPLYLPMDCALEAESWLRWGRLLEARAALDAGFAEVERQNNRAWQAELLRISAELVLAQSGAPCELAEVLFRKALDLANEQGARLLALRAATGLARLLWRQQRQAEARGVLELLLDSFTEGFDTPDLKDARAVLDSI